MPISSGKINHIKRSLAQSNYITAVWNWFMILAGKAAEPVLVASVLYASVKLLPVVHFPPQYDVVVFIAQFVALDVGGLSLNKLADQAKKDGNEDGAKQAKRLSIALVSIMLVGVIMAGVDQIIKLDGQVGTIIDTIFLIARAVMAVLYSRVIHSLKKDDELELPSEDEIEERVAEKINTTVQGSLATLRQEIVSQLEASLSLRLEERPTELDMKQTAGMAHLKEEQAALSIGTVTEAVETALCKRTAVPAISSPKVRSITEAASRKRATAGGEREIDKVVWPLLNTGLSVRAIAAEANTSTATVGRSRKRWVTTKEISAPDAETHDTPFTVTDNEMNGEIGKRA